MIQETDLLIQEAAMYKDSEALMKGLREAFNLNDHVDFFGAYTQPADPLVSDRKCVQMTVQDIWAVTGYHFTWVDI